MFLIEVEIMKKSTKIVIAGIVVGVIVVAAVGIKQHVTVDQEGAAIAIIGGADGPTSVFLAGKLTGGENQVAEYTSITMEDAKQIFQEKGDDLIVDVRRADEFAEGHIPGAINIANEDIVSSEPAELPHKHHVIYVYCRSGNRSKQASAKLAAMGYTNIVECGGILDWTGEVER